MTAPDEELEPELAAETLEDLDADGEDTKGGGATREIDCYGRQSL